MIEYIKGEIVELNPSFVVVENNGMGYFIHISLTTYAHLQPITTCQLYIFESIREDAHVLYGFSKKEERQVFLHLISVSGVGANTARVILSSLSVQEIQEAIATANENVLKAVKGIGLKTAQRIIVDLKDKLGSVELATKSIASLHANTSMKKEAVSALVMLGFVASASQKVVDKILADNADMKIEDVIKKALKML
jgi:holliday junction DNA helicase RuvA